MRAAVFKGAGTPLVLEQTDDPTPGLGEAVIKVGRCGICGTDLHMTSGHGMDFPANTIPGHEFAGEIVAVGPGIERLKLGHRVTAMPAAGCGHCAACVTGYPLACPEMQGMMGGFGEYLRIRESSAIRLPDSLSLADGALVEPLAVGLRGAILGDIRPGARVLVLGAGSVGLATLFWARQLGAGAIVAASPSARRKEMAQAMGADAFETLGEGEGERIAAALGGMPDVVFECAGAVGLLQKSVELVRPAGTIVSLGFCAAPDPVVPALATWKQVTIKFSFAYDLKEFEHAADTLDRGHVEPRLMITDTVSMEQLPGAFEALKGPSHQCKVMLDPWTN
jgi:threonine dehydrogenase-like Zn-dependent dehydrogenase